MAAKKTAMLFPGQGSQYAGMGKDLAERFPAAAEIYRQADDILEMKLSRLCFQGDPEVLTETRNAQPAILLCSVVVARILSEEAGVEPAIAAGHSLGEYSALACVGALEWTDALRIVRRRGELMYEAGLRQPGTMAAIIGLEREVVDEVCREAASGGRTVVTANINAPGQIVVSGEIEAVEEAMRIAESKGASKVVRLNVSGAFHSPLVASAQTELVDYIRSFPVGDAPVGVITNADAKIVRASGEIIDALSRQLTSPVLWSDSMTALADRWDGEIMEVGPGKVLTGLMKRIRRDRPVASVGTADQVAAAIEAVAVS
ncbi:MAG: ACP S-malonyltransferase [Candidatus Krumholzibacteria bacterium]|nr:ACP S-malonyltransferase [Candidatus Krumholzibacteria bacterium]